MPHASTTIHHRSLRSQKPALLSSFLVPGTSDEQASIPRPLPASFTNGSLLIRTWRHDDVDAMRDLVVSSLSHLRPWMAWAEHEPLDDDRRRAMFDRWNRYHHSGAGAVYAVLDDDVLVGGCALHGRVGPGGIDLGYWLGSDFVGGGRATEVARLLTTEALALDTVDFVQISHESRNEASGRVPQRLGFDRVDGPPNVTTWSTRSLASSTSG